VYFPSCSRHSRDSQLGSSAFGDAIAAGEQVDLGVGAASAEAALAQLIRRFQA